MYVYEGCEEEATSVFRVWMIVFGATITLESLEFERGSVGEVEERGGGRVINYCIYLRMEKES